MYRQTELDVCFLGEKGQSQLLHIHHMKCFTSVSRYTGLLLPSWYVQRSQIYNGDSLASIRGRLTAKSNPLHSWDQTYSCCRPQRFVRINLFQDLIFIDKKFRHKHNFC